MTNRASPHLVRYALAAATAAAALLLLSAPCRLGCIPGTPAPRLAAPSGASAGAGGCGRPPPLAPGAAPDGLFFVIFTPPYNEGCGGCTVLHLLAHRLNLYFGRDRPIAYVVGYSGNLERGGLQPKDLNPAYATPPLPPWLNASDGVVVYPESVEGNPLGAKRVVRYVMYFPGVGGRPTADKFPPSQEMLLCYKPAFCTEYDPAKYEMLPMAIRDYYFDFFDALPWPPGGKRSGTIVNTGKGTFGGRPPRPPGWEAAALASAPAPPGSFRLKDEGKRARLEMFARAETFITYDLATFRSVEAAMAGALSIVMPYPNVTREEWMESMGEDVRYGVAYGPDDAPHARATLDKVMPHMKEQARREDDQLCPFVEAVRRRWPSR